MNEILEILKYILPASVVLLATFLIINAFLEDENKRRNLEFKKITTVENQKIALPLRLQAYERIIVFLERIHPYQLIQRIREPQMTVADFHLAILNTIRVEYEYNLSQQIYIGNDAWTLINTAKEETIKQMNVIASQLPNDANSMELSKAILDYFMQTDKSFPVNIAINFVKEDVKNLF